MHIPDGFLSLPVSLTLDAMALPAAGWVARRASREPITDDATTSRIPLLGVMGAFVFAAQMINVPIGLGSSAHLLGGALLAAVLGPASAALVLTAVLIMQALLFQDGGILAMGANIFNMALVGVLAGALPCRIWGRRPTSLFVGGFLSVVASGALALIELAFSGVRTSGWPLQLASMLFLIAGLLEGAITVAVFRAIARFSPAALVKPAVASRRMRVWIAATAIFLAMVGFAFASTAPDGLTQVARQFGLSASSNWPTPFAGYTLAAFGPAWIARPAAGLLGIVCLFGLSVVNRKRL